MVERIYDMCLVGEHCVEMANAEMRRMTKKRHADVHTAVELNVPIRIKKISNRSFGNAQIAFDKNRETKTEKNIIRKYFRWTPVGMSVRCAYFFFMKKIFKLFCNSKHTPLSVPLSLWTHFGFFSFARYEAASLRIQHFISYFHVRN